MNKESAILVLHVDRDFMQLRGSTEVRAIVWPGMGAQHRTVHDVRLKSGETTDEWRHDGEAVYYVVRGSGWFEDRTAATRHEVRGGLIVHITPHTSYVIAAREQLDCIGGPCPPDLTLYDRGPDLRG